MTLTGRCLCEGVQYEISEAPQAFGLCHCTRCQRQSGGANQAFVMAQPGTLEIKEGEELLRTFSEEGHGDRTFCTSCGSSLFCSGGGMQFVFAGTLADDPGLRPQFHAMVDYIAPWEEIHDDLPQFPGLPPME